MKREFAEYSSNSYYCCHLSENDSGFSDTNIFSIARKEGQGLLNYLQNYAVKDEKQGIARTYLVRDNNTDELVGYFSLKASLVTINERKDVNGNIIFDTVPAVELSNFATNDVYKEKHPDTTHIGEHIFTRFILEIIKESAKHIGVYILCIFALPYDELIKYYNRLGFLRLSEKLENDIHQRIKPLYDESCIFMYQRI